MIGKFVCVSKRSENGYHVKKSTKTFCDKLVMFNKWKKLDLIVLMRIKSSETVTCEQ